MQITLLATLENALRGGKFEFSAEGVRQRCKDYRSYDRTNFTGIFKKNYKFFKSLSDDEHIELSPDGKAELAEVALAIIQ